MNLGKFSVNNSVFVNILMVSILIMGTISFFRLPRELESDISFSWVIIAVPYPGVSAEEIEKNITIKIENEISDVDYLKRISSTSYEGLATLMVEFQDDISDAQFRRVYQDLRAEFDKVTLPEDALEPLIDDFSSSDFFSIITLNLTTSEQQMVMNETARKLRDKILDIDGVSKVELVGGKERKIHIDVDRDKIEAWKISLDEIERAIQTRNITIPGGTLETGTRSYILRTIGEMKNLSDFNSVIIRTTPGMGSIKLSDLATIHDSIGAGSMDARFNGQKAISLVVSKKIKANSIDVVTRVRSAVEEFKQTLPSGVKLAYSNDTTWFIRDALSTLGINSLAGFFTLVLVLLVFIGLRNSFLTALGIPIAFSITFIFMEMIGETLNGNSLFALVLVLGMLVDHAIVIIENCYRYRQEGLSKHDAAIKGTNEVILPVIAATGTTIAAFLPLMILPGIMGKFMRIIPLVVSLALIASTFEALVFLPSHFADWSGRVRQKGTGFIGRLQSGFRTMITSIYRHRYITSLVVLIVIVITFSLFPLIKQDLYAGENFSQFSINIELPVGTSRTITEDVVLRFEERLKPLIGTNDIVSMSSSIGFMITETEWLTKSNVAQISIDIRERGEGRTKPVIDIVRDIQKKCNDIPGAESVTYTLPPSGPPRDKPIAFRFRGNNYADMSSVAADFRALLSEYPEIYNISDNYTSGSPELRIRINEEHAASLGLNPALVGLYIRKCFEGNKVTTFYDEDEEIDVIIRLAEKYRDAVEDVQQIKIPSLDGRYIPFSTICRVDYGSGLSAINRVDKKREIKVTAETELDNRQIKEIMNRVEEVFNQRYEKLYPDISLKMGGEFVEFNKVLEDVLRLLGVGLFLMYVILGAQFKSFFQPFIMGLTIFFALIGCILYLVISQTPLSIVVLYAVVALAGIAVNDSIVLISFANNLRRKGMGIMEAVPEAATIRLRPIILTSVTTIGGLIPMAIGVGGYSPTWGPMASTIIFGLFFSTIGTLVVIPCAYGILDDITTKVFRRKMRLEGD